MEVYRSLGGRVFIQFDDDRIFPIADFRRSARSLDFYFIFAAQIACHGREHTSLQRVESPGRERSLFNKFTPLETGHSPPRMPHPLVKPNFSLCLFVFKGPPHRRPLLSISSTVL